MAQPALIGGDERCGAEACSLPSLRFSRRRREHHAKDETRTHRTASGLLNLLAACIVLDFVDVGGTGRLMKSIRRRRTDALIDQALTHAAPHTCTPTHSSLLYSLLRTVTHSHAHHAYASQTGTSVHPKPQEINFRIAVASASASASSAKVMANAEPLGRRTTAMAIRMSTSGVNPTYPIRRARHPDLRRRRHPSIRLRHRFLPLRRFRRALPQPCARPARRAGSACAS